MRNVLGADGIVALNVFWTQSKPDGLTIAENIRRYVAAKKVVNRRTGTTLGQITLSIGAAEYRPGETAASLVHRADEALYLAKNTGRNRVVSETELPATGG